MTKPIVRDPIYRRRRFDAEIIEVCVRCYITYRLSYRDLTAMMAERSIIVSHTTILRREWLPPWNSEKRFHNLWKPTLVRESHITDRRGGRVARHSR